MQQIHIQICGFLPEFLKKPFFPTQLPPSKLPH